MSSPRATALPVLMYHGLHAGADAHGRYDPVYSVHPSGFARQLDWLLANGHHTIRIDDAAAQAASLAGSRPVIITFDDGDVSNVEIALPLLLDRGMVAEFFITSDFVGQPGMLASGDVRRLADAGMGIGAHGRSHRFLEDLDVRELEAELQDSRSRLAAIAGCNIEALALPGGRGGERERNAALRQGYRHLFGSMPGPNPAPGAADWWQRIAITRSTSLQRFAQLVQWQGVHPRLAQARFMALSWPKRLLGNAGYERLRTRLLVQR
ncbi:MAG: polysaccharide deacetylase family protein [Pseudoxanthomonas sp.]